jgi:TIR domain
MNVFICWSGSASHTLAERLRAWLPRVVQAVKPFLSSEDIRKGQRWGEQIGAQLAETNFGVLCVTPENTQAAWVHFEAGALSKNIGTGRVSALLLDVKFSDLSEPLRQFQHTEPTKIDVEKLVRSINASMDPARQLDAETLKASFEAHWPFFEQAITDTREILRRAPAAAPKRREPAEMFEEILLLLRDIQKGLTPPSLPGLSSPVSSYEGFPASLKRTGGVSLLDLLTQPSEEPSARTAIAASGTSGAAASASDLAQVIGRRPSATNPSSGQSKEIVSLKGQGAAL